MIPALHAVNDNFAAQLKECITHEEFEHKIAQHDPDYRCGDEENTLSYMKDCIKDILQSKLQSSCSGDGSHEYYDMGLGFWLCMKHKQVHVCTYKCKDEFKCSATGEPGSSCLLNAESCCSGQTWALTGIGQLLLRAMYCQHHLALGDFSALQSCGDFKKINLSAIIPFSETMIADLDSTALPETRRNNLNALCILAQVLSPLCVHNSAQSVAGME
jgi:hypothetical protein